MELELAMLRNSRTEEERMTVDEASQYLDEQVSFGRWRSDFSAGDQIEGRRNYANDRDTPGP